jgi:cytoskeleton protein RodZ
VDFLAGEILKAKREDLCLNIKEIADRLKIRADYLSAIEEDRYDELPAPVYTMGYIRNYAAYLGVDAESVVRFYREHSSQPKHSTIIPVAHFRKKSPRAVYLLLLLPVVAALFLARPYVLSGPVAKTPGDQDKIRTIKTVPAQNNTIQQTATLPQTPADLEREKTAETVPEQANTRHQAATMPRPDEHSLRVTATALTWISIRFQDGRKEEVTLRPGDKRSWQFKEEAFLRIGNAGGVRINFDGKDVGSPGLSGEVKSVTFPETQNVSG